ncbi:CrcB family protein [Spongiactinospora sp. TRM90649]|uniref:fluoride efflux transporter FluC n=1 Tax=Spongiactinospora sp. TRM90649 TaxID=3031114 RepID=UPI0023F8C6CE|nr:CrcB family protein [Spongiactinospora sp. TRM90649]MDF5757570.1 CrcB family protein [Spongiactinospora sp. TRM90649]
MTLLLVAVGAAVGAPLRYLTDRIVRSRTTSTFPWGTFAVNLAGSWLLGFLATAAAPDGPVTALAGAGFCGALTTYSTFGYETVRLFTDGGRARAAWYAGGSIAAGLAAAFAGMLIGDLV